MQLRRSSHGASFVEFGALERSTIANLDIQSHRKHELQVSNGDGSCGSPDASVLKTRRVFFHQDPVIGTGLPTFNVRLSEFDDDSQSVVNRKARKRLIGGIDTLSSVCRLHLDLNIAALALLCDTHDLTFIEGVDHARGKLGEIITQNSLNSLDAKNSIPRQSDWSASSDRAWSHGRCPGGYMTARTAGNQYNHAGEAGNKGEGSSQCLSGPGPTPDPWSDLEFDRAGTEGLVVDNADSVNSVMTGRNPVDKASMGWKGIATQHARWEIIALGLARQREAPSLMSGHTVIDARNFALGWH